MAPFPSPRSPVRSSGHSSRHDASLWLEVAAPFLRSMITALATGMPQGEMFALRFGDTDWPIPRKSEER